MPLKSGDQVSANLRLVRKLGQGAMGSVWVAEHLTLKTQVAVKFILSDGADHPQIAERFSREATTAAQMKHPHAVQILDHGTSDQGAPYIAMELLEGEDLRKRLKRQKQLSSEETSLILAQTCRALGKAHALGLVHRDIKPDNIFLTEVDGEPFVKVLDFGIAREIGGGQSATASGALVGTPFYMSPEQAMSARDVDARADLWSAAVVAYECITGSVPFDAETMPGVFVAIAKGVFSPPSQVVGDVPAELDAWFQRALSLDPAARFASARELAESFALAILSNASTVHSLPPARSQPAASAPQSAGTGSPVTFPSTRPDARSPRRRILVAAAVAIACALAAVGGRALLRSSPPAASHAEPQVASAASASASTQSSADADATLTASSTPAANLATPPASAAPARPEPVRGPPRRGPAPPAKGDPAKAPLPDIGL
jgi:eukaryotic-like serine/threonine-protein kinase